MLTMTTFNLTTSESQNQHNNETFFDVGMMGIFMFLEIQTGYVGEPAQETDCYHAQ